MDLLMLTVRIGNAVTLGFACHDCKRFVYSKGVSLEDTERMFRGPECFMSLHLKFRSSVNAGRYAKLGYISHARSHQSKLPILILFITPTISLPFCAWHCSLILVTFTRWLNHPELLAKIVVSRPRAESSVFSRRFPCPIPLPSSPRLAFVRDCL